MNNICYFEGNQFLTRTQITEISQKISHSVAEHINIEVKRQLNSITEHGNNQKHEIKK